MKIKDDVNACPAKIIPIEHSEAEIDALYIGQSSGLRKPDGVANAGKRGVMERLREKHG